MAADLTIQWGYPAEGPHPHGYHVYSLPAGIESTPDGSTFSYSVGSIPPGNWTVFVAGILDGVDGPAASIGVTVLGQPTEFAGSYQTGPNRMHFTWAYPYTPQPDHFKVFTQDGPTFPSVQVAGDMLEADIIGPAPGYYLMRCAAVDAEGNEYPCAIIPVTVPDPLGPPSGLSVTITPQA